MQKKLIALAIAGLSSAAFAQSNVQVYGGFDVSFFNQSASGTKSANKIGAVNPTNWGLTGTEDLGDGLKAVFRLEGGFSPDTGALSQSSNATTNRLFGRQAYLGLSGAFGTVIAGRLQTPGRNFIVKYDLSTSGISPVGALQAANGHLNSAVGLDNIGGTNTIGPRLDNAVAYVSPTFSGLTVIAAHANFEQDLGAAGLATAVNANTIALAYKNGALDLDYVGTTVGDKDAAAGAALIHGTVEHQFGAQYNFGSFTLAGTYTTHKVDITGADDTDKLWSLLVKVPVSANGSIEATYGRLNKGSNTTLNSLGNVVGTSVAPGAATAAQLAAAKDDASGWGVIYRHNLSKRTWLYAGYSRLNNDGAKKAALQLAPTNAGGDSSTTAFGMSHSF